MQTVEDLLPTALALPAAERAQLAAKLLESLDEPSDHISEEQWSSAWAEELQRRVKSIADGTAKLIPAETVMAELREKLAARRA